MDAPTVSAFAAAFAALAAATVAGIQLYVGHRQSKVALKSAEAASMTAERAGRHAVATFRQAWIYKVLDTLAEYHAMLMTMPDDRPLPAEDTKALATLGTRFELLLNPNEPDVAALLKIIDNIQAAPMEDRVAKDHEMVKLARKVLKDEWKRVKEELLATGPTPPPAPPTPAH